MVLERRSERSRQEYWWAPGGTATGAGDERRYASISEMGAAERIDQGYLGRILQLTLLAPDIAEAILDGRQPEGTTLPRLLEPFPVGRAEQRKALHAVCGA
jgi:hypothetical protein